MDLFIFRRRMELDMPEKIKCPIWQGAQSHPNTIALIDANREVTYEQLYKQIQIALSFLLEKNVKPGDTVVCLARNSFEQAILFWACIKSGIIFLPLNWRLINDQLDSQLKKINCRLLIYDNEFSGLNLSCDDSIEISGFLLKNNGNFLSESTNEIELDREALIIFSAGTTSESKGVVLTVKNLYYSALGLLEQYPLEKSDCWLAALPFFHIGGISILMRTAMAGYSTYIMPSFDPKKIIELSKQKKLIISVVPTMMSELMKFDTENSLKNTRAIIMGGAGANQSLLKEIKSRGLSVLTTYGMTETSSMVTLLSPKDSPSKLNTSGEVLPYREIRISDANHIQVRGKTLFSRFADNTEIKIAEDGWYDTGDIGTIDKEGFLNVTGRFDDMIISGGENISLSEIENSLLEIEAVKSAAVIKHDHAKWGQCPVAFVEVSLPNIAQEDIKNSLKNKLPGFMMPRKIHILDVLPLNAVGKIDRNKLSQILKSD